MRMAIAVAMAMALLGCESVATKSGSTRWTLAVSLTDDQKIELLRSEAHKRGLQWNIWCIEWEESGFQAEAWHRGESSARDSNWERHDRWMRQGSSQADAAYSLYLIIQHEPNHPAKTEEQLKSSLFTPHKNKLCPPELRGE